MEFIEEHFTDTWKDEGMRAKVSTESPDDSEDEEGAAKALKQKLTRKDIKKAKARMVIVSKHHPKRLIMEADMSYEAFTALKTKH